MPRLRPHAVLLLATLFSISACKRHTQQIGPMPITLQTDWYPQPEHGGFYHALLKGYYKDEGLDIQIVPGGPYISGEQQVSSGAAQFSMGSSDQVLVAVSRGLPFIALEATMQQDPQAIMLHKDSPVQTFSHLNGPAIPVKLRPI